MKNTIKAGRAVKVSSEAKAADNAPVPYVNPTLNFATFAKSLFEADWSAMTEIKQTQQAALDAIAARQSSFLERLQIAARDVRDITSAQWDEHIAPSLKAAYAAQDYKAGPSRAACVKVAVLAFVHGIEVPEGQTNFQNFVNKTARPALLEKGVLEGNKGGRKQGTATTKDKGLSAREAAALCLAQTGGVADDVVSARMVALLTLTHAGNWKLLEKLLADGMKLIGK